jgi:Ca2+/Na+ antiporter
MKNFPAENPAHLLRQTRILLALTILMVFASNMIDPPYSSFGIILNFLVIVVLVFTMFRIHRSIVALKSSTSIL